MQNLLTMDNRKTLVTALAVVAGAGLIIVCSVFASDSFTGGAPSGLTICLRVVALTLTAGAYAGVLLFYSKRNVTFRAKLDEAASAPLPTPQKKKKKKK